MIFLTKWSIIIISIFTSFHTSAQENSIDIRSALRKQAPAKKEANYGRYFDEAETELEMVYTGMFFIYKDFISSQDGSTCSFMPSCSEYAVQAIKKHGIIKGAIAFFDRYSRCNSLTPGLYKKNTKERKLIDEVGKF